jgi:protein-S-isoprenylcysteine O-methyltransferase Ste14
MVCIAIGGVALIDSFARFVVDGLGTPAPVAPTEELVVTGLYRWVRIPMYLAVELVIVGQALLLRQASLLSMRRLLARPSSRSSTCMRNPP